MATLYRYFKPVTLTNTTTLTADLFPGLPLVDHLQRLHKRRVDLAFKVDSFQLGSATRIKAPSGKDSILHSSYLSTRVKCNYYFLAL